MSGQMVSLFNLYIVFNVSLLALSAYIFLRITPDIMKNLEFKNFRLFIIIFQLYLTLETIQTLQEFGIISLPDNVYSAICAVSLFSAVGNAFMFYILMLLHRDISTLKRMRSIIFGVFPLFVTLLLLTASLFNGIIFSIESGKIVKGDMYLLLHAISFIYLIMATRISVLKARKIKDNSSKREAVSTVLLVLFLIVWVIIDNSFVGTTILPIAIFAVIFHLFISFQQSGIYTDTLTGMNNRRKAEMFLGAEIANSNSDDSPLYLFMGDINGFKNINDEYGHHEGDHALLVFAEAVKKSANAYNGFAARYGGDEFVWGWRPVKGGDFDPEMVIQDIRHRVAAECVSEHKPYVISLSIGFVICDDPKRNIAYYLKEADRKMYADKQGHYRINR
ncbi:MAG: GGDEF domain-containing protein [Clostridia bacterium]|nr:GGDEF domain-containing protein [Clostridia bacterium]